VLKCIVHNVLGSVQRFLVSYTPHIGLSDEVLFDVDGSAVSRDLCEGERSKENGCVLPNVCLSIPGKKCWHNKALLFHK